MPRGRGGYIYIIYQNEEKMKIVSENIYSKGHDDCMCMCVCVCVRKREREREKESNTESRSAIINTISS